MKASRRTASNVSNTLFQEAFQLYKLTDSRTIQVSICLICLRLLLALLLFCFICPGFFVLYFAKRYWDINTRPNFLLSCMVYITIAIADTQNYRLSQWMKLAQYYQLDGGILYVWCAQFEDPLNITNEMRN